MGLDVYLSGGKKEVNINSEKHPKHIFKIGYFRSSYNEAGFNTVLRNREIEDLYWIFNNNGRKYDFKPNWTQALKRVQEVIVKWKAFMKSDEAKYSVTECMCSKEVKSKEEALKIFFEEKKTHSKWTGGGFGNFSSGNGSFFLANPLKVCGVVSGKNCINSPTTYVIHQVPPSNWKWYLDALEVVDETIKYVLSQKNKDSYKLHWSS
jgi:hypothetical protein